jgi:DNA repair ATPase RecN
MSGDNNPSGLGTISQLLETIPNDSLADKTYYHAMKVLQDKLVPIVNPDTALLSIEQCAVEIEKILNNITIYDRLIQYTEKRLARLLEEHEELDTLCKVFNNEYEGKTILKSELSKKQKLIDESRRTTQLLRTKLIWYSQTKGHYAAIQETLEGKNNT